MRTSRGSGHWVIVPNADATTGAPALEAWLDAYLAKTLGLDYYVGLLSAAEIHGASPHAVMVTQVMVSKARRPLQLGRHRLEFHERAHLRRMPTQWHETANGRFRVSTPELTAVELISRQQRVGGAARVLEVLRDLVTDMSMKGLVTALNATDETPTAQRLGVLLTMADRQALADGVRSWLDGRRVRVIALSSGEPVEAAATPDARFKVLVPKYFAPANA